jgi:hypothetical protein
MMDVRTPHDASRDRDPWQGGVPTTSLPGGVAVLVRRFILPDLFSR